jgi:protein-S-isoprenylcysteine O-methyltransferase Ste14
MTDTQKKPRTFRRWLKSTSNRTFVVFPVVIILLELFIQQGRLQLLVWGLPLLLWGYLQYRLGGVYRTRFGGGGPGIDNPPERIVDTGIYAWTRNPMYLGHLIFIAGLAITFRSLPGLLLLIFHIFWFNLRAQHDEAHLQQIFGEAYLDYMKRVKRWIPGLY